MNVILAQLKQWPPTTTTVLGIGVLLFAVDYYLSGNLVEATAIAGFFKIICPQDAGVVDQAVTNITPIIEGEPHA